MMYPQAGRLGAGGKPEWQEDVKTLAWPDFVRQQEPRVRSAFEELAHNPKRASSLAGRGLCATQRRPAGLVTSPIPVFQLGSCVAGALPDPGHGPSAHDRFSTANKTVPSRSRGRK